MKEAKLERGLLNIDSVLMPSHMTFIFNGIKEHTLERNPKNVINVVNPFLVIVIFKGIR